jgi:hypothetical protein
VTDSRVEACLRDQSAMEVERSHHEATWREVTGYVFPRSAEAGRFGQLGVPRRLEQPEINDSSAGIAAMRAAAFLESALTPRGQHWHHLKTNDTDLDRRVRVKAWLEATRDLLFSMRDEAGARHAVEVHEVYLSLVCFGTACLSLEDRGPKGWRYRAVPLAEIWLAESRDGAVDKVHRRYELTGRQALQDFGEGPLGAKLAEACAREPLRRFPFLQCVGPNEEPDPARADFRGMPIASYHVAESERRLVRERGYRTMPYLASRLWCAPGEVYGRGLAGSALPTVRQLNRMKRALVNAANRAVEPPLLAADDDLPAPRLTPNAVNPGWLSAEGKPLLVPLVTGERVDIGVDLLRIEKDAIADHFLTSLFDILREGPQMTATEVLQRASEKGILLSPIVGQQQDELLGPQIEREVDLAWQAGRLRPPPQELEGKSWRPVYDTPVTRMLRAEEGAGLLRTLEAVAPLGQARPEVWDQFKPREVVRVLAGSFGAPASCLADDDELDAAAAARDQAAREAQALEAAKVVPGAAAAITRAGREAAGGGAAGLAELAGALGAGG